MAKIIDLGLLGADHPVYNGQIVFSSKKSKKESMTSPAVENSDTQKKNNSQHYPQMDKPKN